MRNRTGLLATLALLLVTACWGSTFFLIKVVRTPLYIGVDRVVRQSPGSGDSVPKGSVVTVYVV